MRNKSLGLASPIQVRDVRTTKTVTYASLAETSAKTGVGVVQLSEHLRKANASKRTWNWLVFRYASKAAEPWPELEPFLAIEHSFSLMHARLYVVEHEAAGSKVKKVLPWIEDVNKYLGLKDSGFIKKILTPRTKQVKGVEYRLRLATTEELIQYADILSSASKARSTRLRASYTRGSAESSGGFSIDEDGNEEGEDIDRYRTNDTFNILTQLGRSNAVTQNAD